jgi:hypothetical protein
MDAAMPLGFFENTREIYAEVASYPVVPPEKIKQYWTGIWKSSLHRSLTDQLD